MKGLSTAALVLLLSGCYHGMLRSEFAIQGGGNVHVGMTEKEITEALGEPDKVGGGTFGCHYAYEFILVSPGSKTVEWAWERPTGVMVAYLENGVVSQLGWVERKS